MQRAAPAEQARGPARLIAKQAKVQRRIREQQPRGVAAGSREQVAARAAPVVLQVKDAQVHLCFRDMHTLRARAADLICLQRITCPRIISPLLPAQVPCAAVASSTATYHSLVPC